MLNINKNSMTTNFRNNLAIWLDDNLPEDAKDVVIKIIVNKEGYYRIEESPNWESHESK